MGDTVMPNDWDEVLDDRENRHGDAVAMGGEERLHARRADGRLDARQRVELLCDPGTFVEIGALVGALGRGATPAAPADGLVAGHGLLNGRPVMVGAEDFTVMGGSIGIGTMAKRHRLVQLATQERVPLIMLLEGAGARAQNAYERHPHAPNDLQALAALSGLVPTVAVVMGPSAGHGALTAALVDLVVMVDGSALFAAGPPLVEAATGEKVTAEELGGASLHTEVSGVAHNRVPDDPSAIEFVRSYLSYLPSNAWQAAPAVTSGDTGPRQVDAILDVVPADPRRPYDIRSVCDLVFDEGSVLEISPIFGASVVTALARLGGESVAIVANQPAVKAGAIDANGADKAAHFIDVASASNLPIIFLADNPGVLAGTVAERSGILRHAARMFVAQSGVRGPKLHVTLRKAYGFGSSLMAMNPFDGQTVTLAFPGARLGAMPAESGADAAGVDADVREVMAQAELGGAYSAADNLSYDAVIDPRDLRNALLSGLRLSIERRRSALGPAFRHSIRP